MAAAPGFVPVTLAEYLAAEECSDVRLELIDGDIRAMAGETLNHSAITANLVAALRPNLKPGQYRTFVDGAKVAAGDDTTYLYPDVTVVCGPVERSELVRESIRNPKVIFEVLSPSTEAYDRGRKFKAYASLPSLDTYVLVGQDLAAVDVYTRQPDGSWRIVFVEGLEATVPLTTLDAQLTMAEIYADVDFEASEA
jgi:Uma2 family endonuclease